MSTVMGEPQPRPALECLLRPRSVAIVGASPTPFALGASVFANLERLQFKGDIHLVNPKRNQIGQRPCVQSIEALPMGLDVAVLAIPGAGVLPALRALAERGTRAAIVFAAGFAEEGSAGQDAQREMARLAADTGMLIEGPNCLGMVNYVDGVALTFVETPVAPVKGQGVAIVSQSGALAAVLGVMLAARGVGVTYSVSTGNEAVCTAEDFLEHLLEDAHSDLVAMVVEQFRQPARFLELAARARAAGKLLVLLHPGRSSAARESAATHTGALAGDYAVMRAMVDRAGVLLVDSLEELSDVTYLAARSRTRPAEGLLVVTESGAFKALALDHCDELELLLPQLTDENAPLLRDAIPPFVPVSNPLDLTAQALVDPDLYRRTLRAALDDERCGTLLLCIIQTDPATAERKFPHIIAALRELRSDKSVLVVGMDEGAEVPASYVAQLAELGVPYYPAPTRALRSVASLMEHGQRSYEVAPVVKRAEVALGAQAGVLPEYQAKALLAPLGIRFPEGSLATSFEEAAAIAAKVGYPVVLKAQASALSHKSDVGGVVLGLGDEAALHAGWMQVHARVQASRPGLVLDGLLVERMGQAGVEMIVGGKRDPDWGPVLLVGMGGVQAEVTKDVRLLPADLPGPALRAEIAQLKSSALLRGYRGAEPLDVDALVGILLVLGSWLIQEPRVLEIDLNPVVLYGSGAVALDALVRVDGV